MKTRYRWSVGVTVVLLGTAGCATSHEHSTDAGTSRDAHTEDGFRASPHYVPSNQTDALDAIVAYAPVSLEWLRTDCRCRPSEYGAESTSDCEVVITERPPRSTEQLQAVIDCASTSVSSAALIEGLNDAIALEATQTACLEADGCSGACRFEYPCRWPSQSVGI